MTYEIADRHLKDLFLPVSKAAEALARLDDRIALSPIRDGFLERQHFLDAAASLWVDGELVHLEDLVLHDQHMNIRAPTHEVIRASDVLRLRRRIAMEGSDWSLGSSGLSLLRGSKRAAPEQKRHEPPPLDPSARQDPLSIQLAEVDAVLERSNKALESVRQQLIPARDPLVYEADWDEDARFAEWRTLVTRTDHLPVALRVAIALDGWNDLEVLQRTPWLGRLLAGAVLRQAGFAHLLSINVGLRAIPRERRHAGSRLARWLAILDGLTAASGIGIQEHERLLLAKRQMERRVVGRQANSKLPSLIDLVMAQPVLTASMISSALQVTPQAVPALCQALHLRELTGRSRYRAWGLV